MSLFAVSLFTCRPTMTVTDWQADTGSLEQKWQAQVTSVGVKLAELEQRWRLRLACTRFWTQRRKPSAQVLAQRLALCTHAQVYARRHATLRSPRAHVAYSELHAPRRDEHVALDLTSTVASPNDAAKGRAAGTRKNKGGRGEAQVTVSHTAKQSAAAATAEETGDAGESSAKIAGKIKRTASLDSPASARRSSRSVSCALLLHDAVLSWPLNERARQRSDVGACDLFGVTQ